MDYKFNQTGTKQQSSEMTKILRRVVTELEKTRIEQSRLLNLIAQYTWSTSNALKIGVEDEPTFAAFADRLKDPKSLIPYGAQMYSQNMEDGIIAEIFNRIGIKSKSAIEIGVGDGRENNTRLLLEMGWKLLWLDGLNNFESVIQKTCGKYVNNGQCIAKQKFLRKDNVVNIVKEFGFDGEVDLLSIDIDQNTPHIWEALLDNPIRVVCIEYNASLPPSYDWCVEYEPTKLWDGTNIYGSSLKYLENMASKKGYALVGCDWRGTNAFFVKDSEDLSKFQDPFTAEFHYQPPRLQLVSHRGYRRGDAKG